MTKINELSTRLGSIVDLQCTLGLICDPDDASNSDATRRFIVEDATGQLDIYVGFINTADKPRSKDRFDIPVRLCTPFVMTCGG